MGNVRLFKELWMCLTTKCNAKCSYCWWQKFAKNMPRTAMDRDTIDASINFIDNNVSEGGVITFFGGEPLLEFNSIKYIMDKNPCWNYKIFTNGSLINEDMISFFYDRRDFINIVLSIDGDSDIQMSNRGVSLDYSMMSKILNDFDGSSVSLTLYDASTLHRSIKFLHSIGAKIVKANVPEFLELPDNYFNIVEEQVATIKSDESLRGILDGPLNNKKLKEFCKCGEDKFSILSDGGIYPCDVFACFGENRIGDVFSGVDLLARKDFIDIKNKECSDGAYCSCYVNHMYHNGKIGKDETN